MRMTPLISLGASVVLGAGAILFGRMYVSSDSKADAAVAVSENVAMQTVLVVGARIEPGEQLMPSMFRSAQWPETMVPQGVISEFPESEEPVFARSIMLPGEPVFADKLDQSGSILKLAAAISPGKRAVSLDVDLDSGVSGFVLPGDYVDVMEFVRRDDVRNTENGPQDYFARRVIENVKVLAVDQNFDGGMEGTVISRTVTLEVTPDQALAVGISNERGALGLALIGRQETIDGLPAAIVAEAAPAPTPVVRRTVYRPRKPATTRVKVINGIEETEVVAPISPDVVSKPTDLTKGKQ